MRRIIGSTLVALFVALVAGCETAPKTPAAREALVDDARAALQTMKAKAPDLQKVLDQAHGYAVFPDVGKGGIIVGGAYGRGVLFAGGTPIGYVELNQASVGATLGGQTYMELLVFKDAAALNRIKSGNFDLGAEASAVALKAGAGAAARFEDGVAVFTMPKGGAMFDASVSGQKFNYQPMTDRMQDRAADKDAHTDR